MSSLHPNNQTDPSRPAKDRNALLPNPDVRSKQQPQGGGGGGGGEGGGGGGGGGKKGKKGKKGKQHAVASGEAEAEAGAEVAEVPGSEACIVRGTCDQEAVRLSVDLCSKVYRGRATSLGKTPDTVGPYPTLGLTAEDRKEAHREIFPSLIHLEYQEMVETCHRLWQLPERDFQYLVLDLLRHGTVTLLRSSAHRELFALLRFLVATKPMRDTVDVLATKHLTTLAYLEPAETWPQMDQWLLDPNPWVVRAAILHQHGMGDFTDSTRLFRYCRQHMNPSPEALPILEDAVEEALQRFADTFHVDKSFRGLDMVIGEVKAMLKEKNCGLQDTLRPLLLKLLRQSQERRQQNK